MDKLKVFKLLLTLAILLIFPDVLYSEQSVSSLTEMKPISGGDFFAFFGIFLIGLALNLTPCVYPMIAITISIFGGQTERSSWRVFIRALLYVLGIATMYSVLGVFAALTGSLFGGILQSAWVLAAISAVFFLMALSMFGLFEMRPPVWLLNKIGNSRGAGSFALFVSGLFVGVFAAPCIGPPIVGLITMVAHHGDPYYGFLVFFVLSLGLGFPYLILGTFSGLMKRMPRSGSWMLWVKKLMGIILVAAGFFYLSLAFGPSAIFILIPLTLVIGGFYLGFLENSEASGAFKVFKQATGIALVSVAVIMFMHGQKPSLIWQSYSSESINSHQQSPSVLYFSASWCIPCLELDRTTFAENEIIQAMTDLNAYKVDLSHYNSEESVELRKKYRITGVPTLIFLDASGSEINSERIVGFIGASELLQKIKRVGQGTNVAVGNENAVAANEEKSTAKLIADVTHVQPGKSFMIGVLFEMQPDWYIYWKNPGDSGTEPQLSWSLSEGLEAGHLQWPAPRIFTAGPFTSYGHDNSLLLFREVQAGEALLPGTKIKFSVDASWLVCKDHCVGQDAILELELEVKNEEATVKEQKSNFFSSAAERVAKEVPEWHFAAEYDSRRISLQIIPPPEVDLATLSGLQIFPEQIGLVNAGGFDYKTEEGKVSVNMVRTGIMPESNFSGVLVLPEFSGERFLSFSVNWQ